MDTDHVTLATTDNADECLNAQLSIQNTFAQQLSLYDNISGLLFYAPWSDVFLMKSNLTEPLSDRIAIRDYIKDYYLRTRSAEDAPSILRWFPVSLNGHTFLISIASYEHTYVASWYRIETIRKNEPDIIPWAKVKTGPIAIARNPIGDLLDDMLCMVDYEDDTLQVKNMYETEKYEERVRMIQRWYQKGYLQKDILTSGEYGQALLKEGMAFSTETVVRPDEREYLENMSGDKVAYAVFDQKPLIDTECDWVYVWCIARNCTYPKEAVQALNAIYEDQDILTTILYGLEGADYVERGDGHLENPPETEENDDSYQLYYKWMFNRLNAKLWVGVDENVKEEMEEMKQDAIVSPAYGFWFDASKVSVDLVKIQNVINKYKDKLNCGVCDVDQVLPQFRKELRQAGSEQLVKEVQQQVDEWKAAQEGIVP